MYLAMYKNGSVSSGLGPSDEVVVIVVADCFVGDDDPGDDDPGAIVVDNDVAGEDVLDGSVSVEEPMDETFLRCLDCVDSELSEFGDADWIAELKLGKMPGLGVGWMSHCENSAGTVRPCAYWSFKYQQRVAVCP